MSHTAQHTSCCGSHTSCASKPRLQPLANRILVRRLEKQQTVGSILLPDSAKKEQEQAEVVAVGPGKLDKNGQLIPMPVQVGQRILMEKYSGQKVGPFGDDDEEFIILRDSDVIAIIEE
jgi:chaperonin GroES